MKLSVFATLTALCLVPLTNSVVAQSSTPPATSASLLVTLEPKRGKQIPPVDANDVTVTMGKEKSRITSLVKTGENGSTLQLLLLIDDSSGTSFDTQISTLKDFVTGLPQTTEIAIGYMRNGTNQMTTSFTRDHAAAAKTIRLVFGPGGADVSPYDSLSEAIKNWPTGAQRREVVMISSGVEGLGGGYAPDNPYVNRGISDAQKAGVVVYTIYNPSAGHAGHSYWQQNIGQNFLSQLSDETGGESYYLGFGAPVSFAPYFQEIGERLANQYVLTFDVTPQKKSELQQVKVRITEKDASIAAADRVFVKAGV